MMDLLIRAVRARHHLTQDVGEALGEHVAALLRQMGDLLYGPLDP